jgi:multiple sugar transport system substrate-binding protein
MRKRTTAKVAAVAAVSALLLAGCAPGGGGNGGSTDPVTQEQIDEAMSTPTTITYWGWIPDIQNQVDMFEAAYPEITVVYENVGRGDVHYQKMRSAMQAGSGAPDVTQMEYQFIPSFQADLLDLTPYGAAELEDEFVASIWGQVSPDDRVLGLPLDFGPMGNLYREDVLAAAGVEVPETWEEYAEAAQTVKDVTGNNITNLPGNDPGQYVGFLWQAGARPFAFDGEETVNINLVSDEAKTVTSYWNELVQADLVDTDPDFTDDWYRKLTTGEVAGWLGAAWSPDIVESSAADSAGLWRVAPFPEWDTAEPASAFWGGSGNSVLSSTKNPIVAAEFVKFLSTNEEATFAMATDQGLYPPGLQTLNNPEFADFKNEFFGGQELNKLFGEIAETVDPDFQWLPFMDYVYSAYNETLGTAIAEHGDLNVGLQDWQDAVVAYAEDQGFTVTTD